MWLVVCLVYRNTLLLNTPHSAFFEQPHNMYYVPTLLKQLKSTVCVKENLSEKNIFWGLRVKHRGSFGGKRVGHILDDEGIAILQLAQGTGKLLYFSSKVFWGTRCQFVQLSKAGCDKSAAGSRARSAAAARPPGHRPYESPLPTHQMAGGRAGRAPPHANPRVTLPATHATPRNEIVGVVY